MEVVDEVLDLLIDLGADEEQLDCPFVYTSAKEGTSSRAINENGQECLFSLRPYWSIYQGQGGWTRSPSAAGVHIRL